MERIFIVLILFISNNCFPTNGFSDSISAKSENSNSLEPGKWALQFGIAKNLTLTNFEGASLSVKRHFKSHLALRLNLTSKYFEVIEKETNIRYGIDKLFSGNLILLYYFNPKDIFNVFGYAGIQYNRKQQFEEGTINQIKDDETFGPALGMGAEFFVHKTLSLFAEYKFNVNLGKREIYTYSIYYPYELTGKQKLSTISIKHNVNFGLSVYF